jgi:hypothetical protein
MLDLMVAVIYSLFFFSAMNNCFCFKGDGDDKGGGVLLGSDFAVLLVFFLVLERLF